jgi:DNA-binding MarR family transcriptional regulator
MEGKTDAVHLIVGDVRDLYPDLEVIGLGITGRIMRLAHYLEVGREEQLAEFGLTFPDFDVLATMRRRGGSEAMKVGTLQRWILLSSGGTTKRLDRLESRGLIERLRDPNDRRGVLIRLTPQGIALIDEAIPAITRFENDLVSSAISSDQQRSVVADGLRRLLIDQETSRSRASKGPTTTHT